MTEQERYQQWMAQDLEDADLKGELLSIAGKPDEIYDRFYMELEFGTAGLRGVIGAGINRMNIYTVRRATQGLADYLKEKYPSSGELKAAIAYDSRIKSELFAKEAAAVLAANGVKAYLYAELMPTPMLSYAVRELKCQTGIVVTASHNPAKYNGYKVYGSDGCQMNTEDAGAVLGKIEKVDIFQDVRHIPFEKGLEQGDIVYIGQDIIDKYMGCVLGQRLNPGLFQGGDSLKVVYTPLNGTGNMPVRRVLQEMGIRDVTVVPEQEKPDGNFPTCPYPNPEIKQTLEKAIALCRETGGDLVLATDPDCDRVGIAVPHDGDFCLLTGNEVGALLLDYICRVRTANGTMPENPMMVKTIVTTKLIDAIAKHYGVEVVNVLTGFKYIGEQIRILEEKGEENRYLLGFEESYGYLSGPYVRDKDAVDGAMLICEMAMYHKKQGAGSLVAAMEGLYSAYGAFEDTQSSYGFDGPEGMRKMKEIMGSMREKEIPEIGGRKVLSVSDYLTSVKQGGGRREAIRLPKSDVLEFALEGDVSVIVRPSGTEPKVKVYYSAKGDSKAAAGKTVEGLKAAMDAFMK